MIIKRHVFCGVLAFGSATAAFACEIPTVVAIPETKEIRGRTQAIQAMTEEYVQDMIAYVDCVKAEIDAAGGEDAPRLLQALLVQRNNSAVAEVKTVMDLFAERIGPLDGAGIANAARNADDLRRSGTAPPVQSRAP